MGRVTSRLGFTRVTLQAYNHKQLEEIVLVRLKDIDSFKRETIQLIAHRRYQAILIVFWIFVAMRGKLPRY
jgi:Cdc6-like AAA superfamily ATPase